MNDSRRRYSRLLRWYPQSWREEHGAVVLDTLEQHASDRGMVRPSAAEAWSLRAHGLGARATHRWAAVAAATALTAFVTAIWILLSNVLVLPGAEIIRLSLAVFIGPLALSLAAVILMHHSGHLSAPAALSTAAGAVPTCGFAAITAASWSIGFDEADAGLRLSWFGSSTLLFLMLAWIAGTFSLVAPVNSVLKRRRHAPIRLAQSCALAAVLALVLGAILLMGQLISILGAAVLLVLALRPSKTPRPTAGPQTARVSLLAAPPRLTAVVTRRKYAAVGAAALVSLLLGIGCAVFALTGSIWAPAVTDSTHAMNLGLAAGALAAIPVTIAAGRVLTQRYGIAVRGAALICCAGLIIEAIAQTVGAGHALQWPLTLGGAILLGFAMALPFARLIPGRTPLRIGATVGLGLAASPIGLLMVTMAAFVAPLGAAALLTWSMNGLSGPGKQSR